MKEDLSKLKVGDTVWLVGAGYRNSDPIKEEQTVVTKVGRKYISVEDGYKDAQFSIESGREKADFRVRQLYIDIDTYRIEKEADGLYRQLTLAVDRRKYNRPHDMTADDIREAAKILKIELKEGG